MKPCTKCTAQIPPEATQCNYCGAPQHAGDGSQPFLQPGAPGPQGHPPQGQAQRGPQGQQVFGPQAFAGQQANFAPAGSGPVAPAFAPQQGYRPVMTDKVQPLPSPAVGGAASIGDANAWGEQLITMLLVFGILLLAVFVAPWSIAGKNSSFAWSVFSQEGAPTSLKLFPVVIAVTGVLALVGGALALDRPARAYLAVAAGLLPIVYQQATAQSFEWRVLIGTMGILALAIGLILRSRQPNESLPKILATVGALLVLVIFFVPRDGTMLVSALFDQLSNAEGKAKLIPFAGAGGWGLLMLVLGVCGLLAWLPAPASKLFSTLAWLLLLAPLLTSLLMIMIQEDIGKTLKVGLGLYLLVPVALVAWESLLAFGASWLLSSE